MEGLADAVTAMAQEMRDRHQLRTQDSGWYVIMPWHIRDHMITIHGSVAAALAVLHAKPGAQMPMVSMMTGAAGIEFVKAWPAGGGERHRFPWCS
jgi:hypothetical protein